MRICISPQPPLNALIATQTVLFSFAPSNACDNLTPMNRPPSAKPSSAPPDLVVRGTRVVLGAAERPAAIHVRSGVIEAITDPDEIPPGAPVHDAGDSVVMPGVVDTHVHINEPGRTEWEGFSTATRAAYREKLAAAAGKLWVDVGFWGGVVPGNTGELRGLWDAGVYGFKCFLVPSGVEEFAHVGEADLRAALPELAAMGAPLMAHSELPAPIEAAAKNIAKGAAKKYATWLAARPREAENEAIALLLRLAREFAARVHVVHLSSSDALPLLRDAKSSGLAISVETCPHYLTFTSEDIADGATQFKCAPPIRERENREKLWQALGDGTIDFIATDHSPCPPAMKLPEDGDFLRAWGGIASLEISLPAVWTEARRHGYAVPRVAGWLCQGPARLAGLEGRKGAIAVGCDADFVIWDPEAWSRVEPARLHHRHKLTPYAGRDLKGVVQTTFLRGRKIFDRGEFCASPVGLALHRDAA
jgi:allantoinase